MQDGVGGGQASGGLSFTIVPADRAHVERLQQIEVDAGELFRSIGLDVIANDDPPSAETLLGYVTSQTAWVALDCYGVAIGYATASVVDGEGHFDQVSVVRSAAGNRVGVALIGAVCTWAAEQGLRSITLTTFRDVAWNGPYYRRNGFAEIAECECGPELSQILNNERLAGIAATPRVAMRRLLDSGDQPERLSTMAASATFKPPAPVCSTTPTRRIPNDSHAGHDPSRETKVETS